MTRTDLYPRILTDEPRAACDDSPVVLIHGARQTGKTTLAQIATAEEGYGYVSFDDVEQMTRAKADPVGFVRGLPEKVVLDEIQRVPEIFSSIKMEVDRQRQPGRFILTGSANVLMLPQLSDSLAGRVSILRLFPLAQAEIERTTPDLLDRMFARSLEPKKRPVPTEEESRDLIDRIVRGGYPAAVARPNHWRRMGWYRDYVETLVQRDVRDLASIHGLDILPDLLTIAAGETARLVSVAEMASRLPRSRPTITDYVTLLEGLFLLDQLPAWSNNRMKRLVKRPKLHISDTGLASALLSVDPVGVAQDGVLRGQLVETFVYQELRKIAGTSEEPTRFFHYRDRDQHEVDLVIERPASGTIGVEVKASNRVVGSDFSGLRKLATGVGKKFRGGYVLYAGGSIESYGDGFYAVPIREMWGEG